MGGRGPVYLVPLPPPEVVLPEPELLEALSPLSEDALEPSLSPRPRPVMPLMVFSAASLRPWAKLPVSARCLPPFVAVVPGVNTLPPLRFPESFAAVASLPLLEAAAPDLSSTDGVLAFGAGGAFSTGVASVNDWTPLLGTLLTDARDSCGVMAAAIA